MNVVRKTLFYGLVILIFVWCVFPLYWAFVSSIKPDRDLFEKNPTFIPRRITFENYVKVFKERPFHVNIKNSIIVAGVTTILSLAVGSLSAYSIARIKFRGKKIVMSLILSVSMFPQISILGSIFLILRALKLINTYTGLILPYTAMNIPLTVWVLQNFFRELPKEIEEAAFIDGASKFRTLWSIVLPMSAPGLVATGFLKLIASWNEFLFASLLTERPTRTVPVMIAGTRGEVGINWGLIAAIETLYILPALVLIFVLQRFLLRGMTFGTVRGAK